MRVGLHALGIGAGARRDIIDAVARAAEAGGFATLWSGEHVVMVDRPRSRYPYSPSGRIAVPPDADWLDPLVGLSFAAAATTRIRVGTGVMLLPEHNPVLVAKQAASLDVLSGGRLVLGVGIGWSADEYAALGVPFQQRAQRMAEYVEVLRVLWGEGVASFSGEFVRFDDVQSYPKPTRAGRIPVVLGGNSDAALERAARIGDGWYGFNLRTDEVRERMAVLAECCRRLGRDVRELDVAVAVIGSEPDDLTELAELGVGELVVVDTPPPTAADVAAWVQALALRWGLAS